MHMVVHKCAENMRANMYNDYPMDKSCRHSTDSCAQPPSSPPAREKYAQENV